MNGSATQFVVRRFERALATGRILPYLVLSMAAITVAYGVLMRIVDPKDFPTVGVGMWWAASTVTTIGYGDVVPTDSFGRLVAAGLMIFGFASLSLLTGIVASVFVHRRTTTEGPSLESIEERLTEIERLLRSKA